MSELLRFNSGLSLEEVTDKYNTTKDDFERVKGNYSGLFSRYKKNMSDADQKVLSQCTTTLLPLYSEESVQNHDRSAKTNDDSLTFRINELNSHIMEYLSKFKNTGVEKISLPISPW